MHNIALHRAKYIANGTKTQYLQILEYNIFRYCRHHKEFKKTKT